MKKKLTYLLILTCISTLGYTQDYQFSQFYASPTILAPSFTGLTEGSRVALNYRDQWPSIPGKFLTYALAFDHYFSKIHSGFGVNILRDEAGAGPLARTTAGFSYSYDFAATRTLHVRPGINLNLSQSTLGFSNLLFADQIILGTNPDGSDNNNPMSGTENPIENPTQYLDASASVIAYTNEYWGGVSADHMLRPNVAFVNSNSSRMPIRLSLFGGYKINLAPRARDYEENVTLAFLYKNKIGSKSDQLDLGVYWTKSPIVLGAWFRGIPVFSKSSETKFDTKYDSVDAIILLVGWKLPNLHMGYSYDFTISDLMNHTGGSHEISLVYEFNRNLKLRRFQKMGAVACPEF